MIGSGIRSWAISTCRVGRRIVMATTRQGGSFRRGLYAENGAPRGRTTCGLGLLTQLAVGLRRIANIGAPHSGQ